VCKSLLKIPNRLGKMSENRRGGGWLTLYIIHTLHIIMCGIYCGWQLKILLQLGFIVWSLAANRCYYVCMGHVVGTIIELPWP